MTSHPITRRIADEAARLLARDEAASVDSARRKAARRLGARNPAQLPDDAAIREALDSYRRLFGGQADADQALSRLRLARDAMMHMAALHPELAESSDGSGAQLTMALRILLYADDPDAALHRLLDSGHRHRVRRAQLLLGDRRPQDVDVLEVAQEHAVVEFWPLPERLRGQPVFDAALGAPLPRRSLREITRALDEAQTPAPRMGA